MDGTVRADIRFRMTVKSDTITSFLCKIFAGRQSSVERITPNLQ